MLASDFSFWEDRLAFHILLLPYIHSGRIMASAVDYSLWVPFLFTHLKSVLLALLIFVTKCTSLSPVFLFLFFTLIYPVSGSSIGLI